MGRNRESAQDISGVHSERRIFEQLGGFNSTTFGFARALVRLADESQKPNAERLPEYTDARRASLELRLYSPAPIHDEFEKLKLTDSLGFMVELLGADNELVKQVLAGKTPEARAEEMIRALSSGMLRFVKNWRPAAKLRSMLPPIR